LHDADNWEKIPILEARAIGYRTGPKIGDFFPMAEERHSSPRKREFLFLIYRARISRSRIKNKNSQHIIVASFSCRTFVSDGNLCGLETREGPQGDPPRGGVLYRRP